MRVLFSDGLQDIEHVVKQSLNEKRSIYPLLCASSTNGPVDDEDGLDYEERLYTPEKTRLQYASSVTLIYTIQTFIVSGRKKIYTICK